jgi:energy-coupling factor transporter ATP-binding protein EcfA2
MNYIRICRGVQDKGILVPVNSDVYKGVDLTKDYYTSAFLYNDEQYNTFKKTGTVAGITDTITNKLYWDFDSADNLEAAKEDAHTLCARLVKVYGLEPSNVALFFSGKKGFQVEVNFTDELFTPTQVKNICLNLGEGLSTLDRQIYNANRILRLPLSRHQDTGLYKMPLDFTALDEASIEDIKDAARESWDDANALRDIFNQAKTNAKINQLKVSSPKVELTTKIKVAYDISDVSWGDKPKFLTPEKFLLSLGFFEQGERSHALMILGSTFKSLGFNETQTYHFLKSAAELQSERVGEDKFPKGEIYKNIIAQIYSPTWKGGVYSVANDELLKRLSTLVPQSAKLEDEADVHDIRETANLFISYAKDIDKNTLKFGIPCLDNNLHIQVGRLYGIIGPPGSGKTSLGVTIHNNTSKLDISSMFFSFDMSKYDVFQKLIQRHTRMDRDKLYEVYKTGSSDQQKKIAETVSEEYKNVRFVFKTGQSIEEMKQTIISTEKKLGIEFRLIVVDYLELVQSKYSDPTQGSAEVIQGLREIAINMNKAVVVFLQPNKMSSTIDEPLLSYNAAKGSSAIAQACTAILTIHRPGYSSRTPETDKFFSIDCVKNRSGRLFSADLHWDGLTGNIRELEDIERMELKEVRDAKKAAKDGGGDIDLF